MEPVFTRLASEAQECLEDTFSRDLRYAWRFEAKTNGLSLFMRKMGWRNLGTYVYAAM